MNPVSLLPHLVCWSHLEMHENFCEVDLESAIVIVGL